MNGPTDALQWQPIRPQALAEIRASDETSNPDVIRIGKTIEDRLKASAAAGDLPAFADVQILSWQLRNETGQLYANSGYKVLKSYSYGVADAFYGTWYHLRVIEP